MRVQRCPTVNVPPHSALRCKRCALASPANPNRQAPIPVLNQCSKSSHPQVNAGVDVDGGSPADLSLEQGIMDLFSTKWWAVRLATEAACTVLKVDQIIMAKQAGGPKPRGADGDDD